jgi:hypothetical protein
MPGASYQCNSARTISPAIEGEFPRFPYACATVHDHSVCVIDYVRGCQRSYRLGPGYVANDLEIHTGIVSEHAGRVNANKSPNDEVERRGDVLPTNEVDLSQSSIPLLGPMKTLPAIARTDC